MKPRRFALMGMRFFLSAALLLALPAQGAVSSFRSAPGGTRLLELFTSEGCNSCPPAEAFIGTLSGDPRLWKAFVPVALHVDYWDYLGWADPLGSPAHTRRQREHGRLLTPQFMLDGEYWPRFDLSRLEPPKDDAGALVASVEGLLRAELRFSPKEPGAYVAHAALLGFGIESVVTRGENAGRTLRQDFAALSYVSAPLKDGAAALAFKPNTAVRPARFGAAFWVTRAGDPRPLQAAGGWLDVPRPKARP